MKKFNDPKVDRLKQLKEAQQQYKNARPDDYVELQRLTNNINILKQQISREIFEELNKKHLLEMEDLLNENEEDLKNLMAMHKKTINKMIDQHQKSLKIDERTHLDRKKQRTDDLDRHLNVDQLLKRYNTAEIVELSKRQEECRLKGDFANAQKYKEKKTILIEKEEKKLQMQKKRQIEKQMQQQQALWIKSRQTMIDNHIKKLKQIQQKNEQQLKNLRQRQEKTVIEFRLRHRRESQNII